MPRKTRRAAGLDAEITRIDAMLKVQCKARECGRLGNSIRVIVTGQPILSC